MAEPKKVKQMSDLELFDDIFPVLVASLTKHGLKDAEISDAIQWFKTVCEYNVPFGKKNRGLTVLHSYRYLSGENATDEGSREAMILGWCVEFLQAFFLVADDIMDASVTRRGQQCWYKRKEVGLIAINDSYFLECAVYEILKKLFKSKPCYVNILELFHETTLQTVIGQNLDLVTAPTDHVDFTNYTVDRYNAIVKWKTAFYSFYLPVALAMYMTGIDDEVSHNNAKTILLQMGEFFQIQDDYLDCFGDPEITGKVGTDIEDNKCGWLCVTALKKATPEQKKFLEENYAQHDPSKVAKVKALYEELGIREAYANYEERSYNEILELIEKLSGDLPKEMFVAYAKKIYKRQK